MMGEAATRQEMTYAEYLAFEEASEEKHEWVDGVVYAMSGGTLAHNQLSAQMIVELSRLIGDRPCRVFTSDQRTRPNRVRLAAYPDVTVVCGEPVVHEEDRNAVTNPLVLVEVLSDSTEGWDRAGKFRRYRKLASLRHYVLVSQRERCIEVYSRAADDTWVFAEALAGESAALDALGGALDVDRVYRNVDLAPPREHG
jgi:Uma2 family endonuclease